MSEGIDRIKVRVTPDRLKAFITLTPSEDDSSISEEDIRSALNKANVRFGVKEDLIQTIVKLQMVEDFLIAEGIPPENGKDAIIEYKISLGRKDLTPKENPDGSVDLRDLGFVENVTQGDILAVKVPPTEGVPGTGVDGESIPPKKGKDIRLPRGKNTEISEDGLMLIATKSGVPNIREGNISVSPLLEIQKDVDFSTGNIDFVGNVLVRGTVKSHFNVSCEGNLEVWEDVENADLRVGGNLVVRRGIYGEPGRRIEVKGNLLAKIIRNAEIDVYGDIIVEQAIIDSSIRCGGKIKVTSGKGVICGGRIFALRSISVSQLGSPFGTATTVVVGKEPWTSSEIETLIKEREDLKKKLEEVNTNIKYIIGYGREDSLPEARKIQLNKLREVQRLLIEQLNLRDLKIKELREKSLYLLNEAKIEVLGIVYPGVRIWVGEESYMVDSELQRVYFIFNNNEGRIEFRSI